MGSNPKHDPTMSENMDQERFPVSPRLEIDGLLYFRRLCDKIRLHAAGYLPTDYHANLGRMMDGWTCSFLGVDYAALREVVVAGADDEAALAWARAQGKARDADELEWFNSYLRKRGFRDDLSARLVMRKEQAGWSGRDEIGTFFDFIDLEEGRELPDQESE